MGFYGNITNTAKTTFSFDHIYHTRTEMDKLANLDGVFLGRYVLINYDEEPIKAYYYKGAFYNGPSYINALKLEPIEDVIYQDLNVNPSEGYRFYEWDPNSKTYQGLSSSTGYTAYFSKDVSNYGRGYDSTVWVKRYNEQTSTYQYVLIAELNAVIPTLHLVVDKPMPVPVTPYFDRDTSNIDYYLHMQSEYGMQIKEGVEDYSDEQIIRRPVYWELDDSGKPTMKEGAETPIHADIFFNKKGFDFAKKTYIDSEDAYSENTINYSMAQSGKLYGHDATLGVYQQGYPADDVYEWYIHLAGIGNAISTMWDKVYDDRGNNKTRALNKAAYRNDTDNHLVSYNKNTLMGMINTTQDLLGYYFIPLGTDGHVVNNSITESKTNVTMPVIYEYDPENPLTDKDYPSYPVLSCLFYEKLENDLTTYYCYSYDPVYHPFTGESLNENTVYYYKDENNIYHLANPATYNNADANGNNTQFSTYYTRSDRWTLMPLEIQTEDSLYALIAAIHKLIGTNADEVRDFNTLKGTINIIKDIISYINLNLKPGTLLHVNDNGVIEHTETYYPSSDFDATRVLVGKQDHPWENRVRSIEVLDGDATEENNWDTNKGKIDTNINNNDNISFKAGNKWIGLEANTGNEQLVTIRHMPSKLIAHNFMDDIDINNNIDGGEESTDDCAFQFPMVETDNAGHVIGYSTKKIYIPYNYRNIHLDTNNSEENSVVSNSGTQSAESTTDTFTFATGNKWIQARIEDDDTLTFAHSLTNDTVRGDNAIFEPSESDKNGFQQALNDNNKLTIPTFTLDNAGHIIDRSSKDFYIPNNFRSIRVVDGPENNDIDAEQNAKILEADTTIDDWSLAPQNKWLRISADPENDAITIGHSYSALSAHDFAGEVFISAGLDGTKQTDNQFTFSVPKTDNAGHVIGYTEKTLYTPNTFKNINIAEQSTLDVGVNPSTTAINIDADNTADTFTIATGNKWVQTTSHPTNNKVTFSHVLSQVSATDYGVNAVDKLNLKFGDTFNIPQYTVDPAGHIIDSKTNTLTLPVNQYTETATTGSNSSVITTINLAQPSGSFDATRVDVGTLQLTKYQYNNNDTSAVEATNTINEAFSKVEAQITQEISNRGTEDTRVLSEANTYTDNAISKNIEQIEQEAANRAAKDEELLKALELEKQDRNAAIQKETDAREQALQIKHEEITNGLAAEASQRLKDIESLLNDLIINYGLTLKEPVFTVSQDGVILTVNIENYIENEYHITWYKKQAEIEPILIAEGLQVTITEIGEYYCVVSRTHNGHISEKIQDGTIVIDEDLIPPVEPEEPVEPENPEEPVEPQNPEEPVEPEV